MNQFNGTKKRGSPSILKSEKEIRAEIKRLEKMSSDTDPNSALMAVVEGRIAALEWVLGER